MSHRHPIINFFSCIIKLIVDLIELILKGCLFVIKMLWKLIKLLFKPIKWIGKLLWSAIKGLFKKKKHRHSAEEISI